MAILGKLRNIFLLLEDPYADANICQASWSDF